MLRSIISVDFISYLKDIKGCIVFQVGPLSKILLFLNFHLKPIAAKVMSYINDAYDFLRKLRNLPTVLDGVLSCTINVVELCQKIANDKEKSIR